MTRIPRVTLRFRLLLVLVAVVAAGLVVSDVATYTALRSFLTNQVDQQLVPDAVSMQHVLERCLRTGILPCQPALGTDNGASGARGGAGQFLQPGTFGELRDASGTVLISGTILFTGSIPAPPVLPGALPGSGTSAQASIFSSHSVSGGVSYRVIAQAVDDAFFQGTVVVAIPTGPADSTLGRLALVEWSVTVLVLLGLGILAWWIVRRGLRPLDAMADTAGAIAAGDLSRRVAPADDQTEIGRLGSALNTMLGEIEEAFAARTASEDRLRRFLADASHELRTPLTSIRGYAEMFDRGVSERPEDLAVSMRHIRSEADRMTGLVEDLLLLARLDRQRPFDRRPMTVASVAAAAVDACRASAPDRTVTLRCDGAGIVWGDEDRLRQVVDNLLANAVQYTPQGSPIDVQLGSAEDQVVLDVLDRGPGVPAAVRQQIFEPFRRADVSRTRTSGGAGLGLAIVAAIVRAHDGSVAVDDRPGGGARFRVVLPGSVPAVEDETADGPRSLW